MPPVKKLCLTSIQAPNQDRIAAALASYLQSKLSMHIEFIHVPAWGERLRIFDAGEIDFAWICGLPYIQRADRSEAQIELLVAPVMRLERYLNQPVYYSDVIVRHERPFRSFEDLRGSRWAYNEPNSHSGYNLTRYMLAQMREYTGYFSSAVQAGSHQAALQMLLTGQIDAIAIDSTVLEVELEAQPEIANQIRTLTTWGPSPIPPWVIQKNLPAGLKAALREAILSMEAETEGQQTLARLGLNRFVHVNDRDYDPIREMSRIAQSVQL